VIIEVTADDIARGEKGEPCKCPVALACLRAGLFGVEVYENEISGNYADTDLEGRIFHFQTSPPDAVTRFVEAFDGGGVDVPSVAPFTFELSL
jgi:hypothetical protein